MNSIIANRQTFDTEFLSWCKKSQGAQLVYHVGNLAADCYPITVKKDETSALDLRLEPVGAQSPKYQLAQVRLAVWCAESLGLGRMVQRRVPDAQCTEYILVRTDFPAFPNMIRQVIAQLNGCPIRASSLKSITKPGMKERRGGVPS